MDWDIRNYYEYLVKEAIVAKDLHNSMDEDEFLDLVCVTLNKLPSRYIRFHIDMANYLAGDKRKQMEKEVDEALEQSLAFLKEHPRED